GLGSMGFSVTESQLNQFTLFYDLLVEWNTRMNLTTLTEPGKVVTHHFLDSATCALSEAFSSMGNVLDIGTGAGFPGIPLKILFPQRQFTLMDSLRKRITFLQQAAVVMGLEKLQLIHARAEEAGKDSDHREQYDGVVSRAVASLPVLLEYAVPFLRVDGFFLCQKGPRWQGEIQESERAMRLLSVSLEESLPVRIPLTDMKHHLLVFRKTASTPSRYPRKPGTPAKKPL
ncbi:MAG: 16S rRNA (guanine(527)-N(7))-methyltransferase RsmG, partial [Bacillota bacterium]|nr:16S rRNA (guanine(527)-N(7))-methyltransferase RsmG [Bacillota bacterium]